MPAISGGLSPAFHGNAASVAIDGAANVNAQNRIKHARTPLDLIFSSPQLSVFSIRQPSRFSPRRMGGKYSQIPIILCGRHDATQALRFDAFGFAIERESFFAEIGFQYLR